MVKAKPKEYEDFTSPGGTQRRLRLAPGTASGYYGVIKNKGNWQGMGYDPKKQSRRPLPGLFEKPQDAAAQVAKFDSRFKLGTEKIPSPKKYAKRGSGICAACRDLPMPWQSIDCFDADCLSRLRAQARSCRRSGRLSRRGVTRSPRRCRSDRPRPRAC